MEGEGSLVILIRYDDPRKSWKAGKKKNLLNEHFRNCFQRNFMDLVNFREFWENLD